MIQIHAVVGDLEGFEEGNHLLLQPGEGLAESSDDHLVEDIERGLPHSPQSAERVTTGQVVHVNGLANVGNPGQVPAPGEVALNQRDTLFDPRGLLQAQPGHEVRMTRRRQAAEQVDLGWFEQCLFPAFAQDLPLPLDHGGVSPQRAADVEVLTLDDPLCPCHLGHRLVRFDTSRRLPFDQRLDGSCDPVALDEIVLQADEELRRTRVSLAAGAAAKLVVDTPTLMFVRTDDMQPAQGNHLGSSTLRRTPEADVGPPACHVGRDRHRSRTSSFGDHASLGFIVPGIQDVAGHACALQGLGEFLGFGDTRRTHEHRPPRSMELADLLDDCLLLGNSIGKENVRLIPADTLEMRRNHRHRCFVELVQFLDVHRHRRAHSRELRVELEEMLQRDRGKDGSLRPHGESFLGLEGGVDAIGPAAFGDDTAGELVDDLDVSVADDIVDVPLQQNLGM
jgi:hypothetical protein